MEPRRDHLRVVENENVPRTQEVGQVADGAVLEGCSRTNDHHPGGIPRFGGAERDSVVRQVEVEKVDAHWVHRGGRGLSRGSGQPSKDPLPPPALP